MHRTPLQGLAAGWGLCPWQRKPLPLRPPPTAQRAAGVVQVRMPPLVLLHSAPAWACGHAEQTKPIQAPQNTWLRMFAHQNTAVQASTEARQKQGRDVRGGLPAELAAARTPQDGFLCSCMPPQHVRPARGARFVGCSMRCSMLTCYTPAGHHLQDTMHAAAHLPIHCIDAQQPVSMRRPA